MIAESVDDRMHPALLFSGDPVERGTSITSFKFRPPTGYRVTDGVQLPDWDGFMNLAASCYELSGLGYIGVDLVLDDGRGGDQVGRREPTGPHR